MLVGILMLLSGIILAIFMAYQAYVHRRYTLCMILFALWGFIMQEAAKFI